MVTLAPLIATLATVVLITALVGLGKGSQTWLRFRSRKAKALASAGAAVALLVSGGAMTASPSSRIDPVAASSGASSANTLPSSNAPLATSTISTPTPTPTTLRTTRTVVETQQIAFTIKTVKDPDLALGKTRITKVGKKGERTRTYRVTEIDGIEVERTLLSDEVTTRAVTQVKAVGTYVAPAPRAIATCDPNYSDGCVPIASDVDCAGGSGNGPAYLSGTARVVGTDIYDLDRDNDGIACNGN